MPGSCTWHAHVRAESPLTQYFSLLQELSTLSDQALHTYMHPTTDEQAGTAKPKLNGIVHRERMLDNHAADAGTPIDTWPPTSHKRALHVVDL